MAENVDYLSALLQDTTIDKPGLKPAQYIETIKQRLTSLGAMPGTGAYENAMMSYLNIRKNQSTGELGPGFEFSTAAPEALDYLDTLDEAQVSNVGISKTSASANRPTSTSAQASSTDSMTGTEYNSRMSVYASMADRFNKYGLTGLANKIKELAIKGATEATITLELQDTPEYQQRFSANAARLKSGLSALTPSEYVNIEDSYRQVLRAYGLRQFDNDAYINQFIANDMSPTEFSNRIVTAVQRVKNADPAITNQLKQYYGIGADDMIAYVLDPQQQFQRIERQIAAAEIGVAAARQGITAGMGVAEQLAAQGVTQAGAQEGYATIAGRLPAAEKLSDIYGGTMDVYRQSEAEQDVFNSLASAQRKRDALRQREIGAFSGSSGVNKASLASETRGKF